MNGLPERLATSCPKTWEGSGDLSGSQGDGMHWGGHCTVTISQSETTRARLSQSEASTGDRASSLLVCKLGGVVNTTKTFKGDTFQIRI